MKKAFVALICLIGLGGMARAGEPALKALTPGEVAQKLHDKSVHVYDCNDPETYKSGHVPGAHNVDYTSYSAKELPAAKGDTLIFYCMNEH